MYFAKFPNIIYDFIIKGKPILKPVRDITKNVRIRTAILDNITLFDEYDMQDGETPEIVAAKAYGSSEYHWVVMLCNQRFNYIEDFPKSVRALDAYVNAKYDDPYGVHHWVNADGFVVQEGPGATSVSNYQFEDDLNESKRRIKLISPRTLTLILNQFKELI